MVPELRVERIEAVEIVDRRLGDDVDPVEIVGQVELVVARDVVVGDVVVRDVVVEG